jgi:hypothetical protein
MIDATADAHGLTISATGTVRIRIHARKVDKAKIGAALWDLPGLRVAVTADMKSFTEDKTGDNVDLVYSGITGMRWEITPAQ